jgi:acid phosphatase type 7
VNWVNLYPDQPATVSYRKLGDTEWLTADGKASAAAPSVLQVRTVEVTDLAPDTTYELVLGVPPAPKPVIPEAVTSLVTPKKEEEADLPPKPYVVKDTRSTYRFRTMPAELTRPVRFVTGGDMMHTREFVDAMNKRAGSLDPDFAILGGDLAYENGMDVTRYIDWFQSWTKNAKGKGGRLIPMVVAIGNHEVRGGYRGKIPEDAPYFYGFFPLPENRSYYALDFGKYLSVIALDTGHTNPVAGEQAAWLGEALSTRGDQRYVFPVYHWPIYGTAKASGDKLPSEAKRSIEMRQQWVPHFERHGVTAIFENDHHNYKRTHPIRGHKRDDKNGIVYLGDGCWGVTPRTVPKNAWYLAKAEPRRHLYHVTLPVKGPVLVEAMDAKGVVFDKTSFTRPRTLPVP